MKMKIVLFFSSLFLASWAQADGLYLCEADADGKQVEMNLTFHQVIFDGKEFNNFTDTNPSEMHRDYSYIDQEWMSMLIPLEMVLHGKDGRIEILRVHLPQGDSEELHYDCKASAP